jgi:hypothetical protein
MKRSLALPLLLSLTALPAFAIDQLFLEPVTPISPALKAQGGASTANAEGVDALFINPAAFANPKVSVVFSDFETSGQMSLTGLQTILNAKDSWGQASAITTANNPMVAIENDLLAHGGLGGEVSYRIGWVGANLGVGLAVESRMSLKGSNILEATGTYDQTYVGVIGMGWPIDVGLGTLKLGASLRPMQRAYSTFGSSDLLTSGTDYSKYNIQSGFGLGWDLGARWDYGPFKTGLAIRDVGSTVYAFKQYSVSQWMSGLTFPVGGSSTGTTLYRVPTTIALGGSWSPDMGSLGSVFQPTVNLDFQIPLKDEFTQPSFWTWTHIGAEAKFLQILSVRTGLNQGYFTFGMGLKLLIMDLNLAIYSDELGRYSGINRRPEISLNLALGI